MARKSARALAAYASSSPPSPEGQQSRQLGTKESGSRTSLKTCLTCGRMITPRAKWSKDWDSIKFCSDRCRSGRPGRLVVSLPPLGGAELQRSSRAEWINQLGAAKAITRGSIIDGIVVDVECLVETALLSTAADTGHRGTKKDATLEDAETVLRKLALSSEDDAIPLWKAIDSPPGCRERVRRAARRLALGITRESGAEQACIVNTNAGKLQLSQNGILLTTVEQLSFAKGTICMRLPPDNT